MARKKSKKKSKAKARSPRKRSEIEILKEHQSKLYVKVAENLDTILRQTGLERDELGRIIEKYGYDAIPEIDGFDIIQPIWERMVKTFKLYDKVAGLVSRMESAQNKIFINSLEKKTLDMEAQLKAVEDEDKFYTQKERDADGMIKLKEKWYAEKEHWEFVKLEAQEKLRKDPKNQDALAAYEHAERELKILAKKRMKVRMQNIQPGIGKWSRKIGKGINAIQDSIGEITKPFAEMGDMSGYDKKSISKQEKDFDYGFNPENVFGGGKKKKDYSWDSGF